MHLRPGLSENTGLKLMLIFFACLFFLHTHSLIFSFYNYLLNIFLNFSHNNPFTSPVEFEIEYKKDAVKGVVLDILHKLLPEIYAQYCRHALIPNFRMRYCIFCLEIPNDAAAFVIFPWCLFNVSIIAWFSTSLKIRESVPGSLVVISCIPISN